MVVPRTLIPGATLLTVRWQTPPGLLLGLDSFRAWPDGLSFYFVLAALAVTLPGDGARVFENGLTVEWRQPGPPPPECVCFSVTFSDGTVISSFDGYGTNPRGVLDIRGGGGFSGPRSAWVRAELGWWLSPLPPPGELVLAVEWPFVALAHTEARVDAGVLREAASRARPLSDVRC